MSQVLSIVPGNTAEATVSQSRSRPSKKQPHCRHIPTAWPPANFLGTQGYCDEIWPTLEASSEVDYGLNSAARSGSWGQICGWPRLWRTTAAGPAKHCRFPLANASDGFKFSAARIACGELGCHLGCRHVGVLAAKLNRCNPLSRASASPPKATPPSGHQDSGSHIPRGSPHPNRCSACGGHFRRPLRLKEG